MTCVDEVIIHRDLGSERDTTQGIVVRPHQRALERTGGDRRRECAGEGLVLIGAARDIDVRKAGQRRWRSGRVCIQLRGSVVLSILLTLLDKAEPVISAECGGRIRLRIRDSRSERRVMTISGFENQRRVPVAGEIEKECRQVIVFWLGIKGEGGRGGATGSRGINGVCSGECRTDLGTRLGIGGASLKSIEQKESVGESVIEVAIA